MSNRTVDSAMERDYLRGEYGCAECGFYRSGAHHPKIKCPKTGRCGTCGNDWPCADHNPRPPVPETVGPRLERIVQTPCPVHGVEACGYLPDPSAVYLNGQPSRRIEVACAYRLNKAFKAT